MNFVDIQINGYCGIDFNGDPLTVEQIEFVADTLRHGGVERILPTIVTSDVELMSLRLRSMRGLIDQDKSLRHLMPAFHIEGPCLSPKEGYRGAHEPQYIQPARRETLEPLLEAAGGPNRVAIVTLAPETDDDFKTVRWLAEQGIIVSAGHTDASREQLEEAQQAGLSMFTHLGNGSADQIHRHDNIITRALSLEQIHYGLIPDGHHIPFFLLKQWIRLIGIERCVFTTDCVDPADAPADYDPEPPRVLVRTGTTPVVRLAGTPYLSGSALTMRQAYRNATEELGLTDSEADELCSRRPAALIAKWLDG